MRQDEKRETENETDIKGERDIICQIFLECYYYMNDLAGINELN